MTICANCEHLFVPAQNAPFWRWMCMKHKRKQGQNPVTGDDKLLDPPYLLCRDVNAGFCPLYEEQKHENEPSVSE